MTNISKHNTEEEGESNAGKHTWVDFFVGWHTIGVHNFLEYGSELIKPEQTRRSDSMVIDNLEGRNIYVLVSFLNVFNFFKHLLHILSRNPTVP
jgi:hypothetical protein